MKSQASKTLSLKKLSISELNTKQLQRINGGSLTIDQVIGYGMPTSETTSSTFLCNDLTGN